MSKRKAHLLSIRPSLEGELQSVPQLLVARYASQQWASGTFHVFSATHSCLWWLRIFRDCSCCRDRVGLRVSSLKKYHLFESAALGQASIKPLIAFRVSCIHCLPFLCLSIHFSIWVLVFLKDYDTVACFCYRQGSHTPVCLGWLRHLSFNNLLTS